MSGEPPPAEGGGMTAMNPAFASQLATLIEVLPGEDAMVLEALLWQYVLESI